MVSHLYNTFLGPTIKLEFGTILQHLIVLRIHWIMDTSRKVHWYCQHHTHTTHHTTCPNSFRDCLSAKKSENESNSSGDDRCSSGDDSYSSSNDDYSGRRNFYLFSTLLYNFICLNLSNKQQIKTKRLYQL